MNGVLATNETEIAEQEIPNPETQHDIIILDNA